MAKFICIEGVSYTGKTTLFENLGRQGFFKANRIANGYSDLYCEVKKSNDFKTKLDFFKEELNARSNDYFKIQNNFVADRYFLSIISHYNIFLKQDLHSIDRKFYNSLFQPNLTILLTANIDTILKREKKRIDVNYTQLEVIQNEFLRLAIDNQNISIIETDTLTIQEVFDKSLQIIEQNNVN